MADRILGPLLQALERVYKFPTARKAAPDSFELDLPIVPVQDMTDIVKLSSGIGSRGGFWVGAYKHAHTVVGNLLSNPDPYRGAVVQNGYPADIDPRQYQIWLYNIWDYLDDAADASAIYQALAFGSQSTGPQSAGGASQYKMPLRYSATPRSYTDNFLDVSTLEYRTPQYPLPVLKNFMTGGAGSLDLKTTSAVGGTVNITSCFLLWCGVLDMVPPL